MSKTMRMWLELSLLASAAERRLPYMGTALPSGAVCVCVSIWRYIQMKSLQKRMAEVVLKWTSLVTKFWRGKGISTRIHSYRSPLVDVGVEGIWPRRAELRSQAPTRAVGAAGRWPTGSGLRVHVLESRRKWESSGKCAQGQGKATC